MEPVNPVLPGDGRWLTGDASARASEETGVQSDLIRTLQTTFQLSQKFFLGLEDCMPSFWSLCPRSLMYSSSVEELVLLKGDHEEDINLTVVRLPSPKKSSHQSTNSTCGAAPPALRPLPFNLNWK